MDITQPIDTKANNDLGTSDNKEKSDSFLALIEEHAQSDKSGNKQKDSGNQEYSKEDVDQQHKIDETKSVAGIEELESEAIEVSEITSEDVVIESKEENSEQGLETVLSIALESEIKPQSDAKELLSFISASDQMSSVLAEPNTKNISETQIFSDEDITLNKLQTLEVDIKSSGVFEAEQFIEGEDAKIAVNQLEQNNLSKLSQPQEVTPSKTDTPHSVILNSTSSVLNEGAESEPSLLNEQLNKVTHKLMEANGVFSKTTESVASEDDLSIELANSIGGEDSDIAVADVESIVITDKTAQNISLDKANISNVAQDVKPVAQMSKESQKLEINLSQGDGSESEAQNQSQNKSPETPVDLTEASADLINSSVQTASDKPAVTNLFDRLSQREASQTFIQTEQNNQSEQSFEHVMSTTSSEVTQTQKSTTIQQAEVISLMQKDATDAIKEKVMVMISQKLQQVDIQLDPPELGNMHVRINMQSEQAVVNFTVQNQQAKEALDQNLDKLKNMMADNGVDVGEANIEQQSKQSSSDDGKSQHMNGEQEALAGVDIEEQIDINSLNMFKPSPTGVDYYA